ncbi:MAG: ATP-binding protein [Candidatus Faecisoma sp.]|jgi:hypothetical protein|nr:ATP-binding protein [Acholeplasma sp.]MCI5677911.1 ATP-binding protein [Acholeplasma sp.]MDY2892534.1 ATP-binding protein [Candidatus Faecisoma sp.]CCY27890.1 putative uncharacterized protein [Acholeplasma sp. CAG:878]
MLGKIIYISNNTAHISNVSGNVSDLMNMHVIIEDSSKKILAEVDDISKELIKVRFLGEIADNRFIGGILRKPSLNSTVRLINSDELKIVMGSNGKGNFQLGTSPLYNKYPISININDLFSHHMAIFGNSGFGKSYGVARLLQNIFSNPNYVPYKANIMLFDAYGEYHNAFSNFSSINPNYQFKYYTTNKKDTDGELLRIPVWLLDNDDLAILLSATEHSQLPIIEQMTRLVKIFASDDDLALRYKNHLIAKAIMNILFTNQSASSKRNDVFGIFNSCTTPQFNMEAPVQGIGYTRKFRECFLIDNKDNFSESVLLSNYVSSFIDDSLEEYEELPECFYTLVDLEKALNFTLISEGVIHNEKMYANAVVMKVRLHSIITSYYHDYFKYNNYITKENYIASLISKNNRKAQIINFNLEEVDDWFGKFVVKLYSKMLFNFTKNLPNRAAIPFHIFLEEAHRYVQKDNDNYLLGYNIFERIAKEGRKYGTLLTLISQRPVEISDTVISQMANFMIFKINHPLDVDYIKKMLPNISEEIIEKQKGLQPGTCMAFGKAFKIPLIVKMDLPNPTPESGNCDVVRVWS